MHRLEIPGVGVMPSSGTLASRSGAHGRMGRGGALTADAAARDQQTSGPDGLDLAALAAYLPRFIPAAEAPLSAELIGGGRSNLTYYIRSKHGEWVLRRPPLGHVLPTAHDMAREYRVISALHGTAVPVPRPIALCPDTDVIGAPFYLMEWVDGVVFRTTRDAAILTPGQAGLLSEG